MSKLYPSDLPLLTVVNSYGEAASAKGGGFVEQLKRYGLRRIYASITGYQRKKYAKDPNVTPDMTKAVHSVIKIAEPDIFLSVTSPRAVVEPLVLVEGRQYRAFAWKHLDKLSPRSFVAAKEFAYLLNGHPYDYGQLVDILVKQWFGWLPKKASVFDFGRSRKVCSVGCHGTLLAARDALPDEIREMVPRPLGAQYVENTCPADFECSPDFNKIGEQTRD